MFQRILYKNPRGFNKFPALEAFPVQPYEADRFCEEH